MLDPEEEVPWVRVTMNWRIENSIESWDSVQVHFVAAKYADEKYKLDEMQDHKKDLIDFDLICFLST